MNYYFKDIFEAFSKLIDRAEPEDLCARDVIRLANLAKRIEWKIGNENEMHDINGREET